LYHLYFVVYSTLIDRGQLEYYYELIFYSKSIIIFEFSNLLIDVAEEITELSNFGVHQRRGYLLESVIHGSNLKKPTHHELLSMI